MSTCNMQHNCVHMQHNYVNMKLNYVNMWLNHVACQHNIDACWLECTSYDDMIKLHVWLIMYCSMKATMSNRSKTLRIYFVLFFINLPFYTHWSNSDKTWDLASLVIRILKIHSTYGYILLQSEKNTRDVKYVYSALHDRNPWIMPLFNCFI